MTTGTGTSPKPTLLICPCFSPVRPIPSRAPGHFSRLGYPTHVVPHDDADMRDTVRYSASIAVRVQEVAAETGGPIALLSHSMGGAAALRAVKRLGIAHLVSVFVSFGAPFRGTNIANLLAEPVLRMIRAGRFQHKPGSPIFGLDPAKLAALPIIELAKLVGYGAMAEQLLEKSAFLNDLMADRLPAGPRFVSLAAANDPICPPERAYLTGAHNEVHPYDSGHAAFLVDRDLYRLIETFLT